MSEFRFKQFTIIQEKTAMKVSTDGVLLGSWINYENPKKILDIGTGTGLLTLMAAQKFPNAEITAIEIDTEAYEEAKENVKNCPWKHRITLINEDFKEFTKKTAEKYDLIISNPPYFENQLKPPNFQKKIAKHTDNLTFEELISNTSKILNENGYFSVIIPYLESNKFVHICAQHGLFIKRSTEICPNENKQANRILIEFSPKIVSHTNNTISIRENKEYTNEYLELTKDFYLFAK